MVEENVPHMYQLHVSPLEGYPLTLCVVTSHIKADRLSISVKSQIGVLYPPSQEYFWDGPELFCEKTSRDRLNLF